MAETTTPRLMAAAKEFNIGKDTLVDFLAAKGFSKDDLKPTAKLTDAMYHALQAEFQGDKAAKIKSELIDLPKGATAETRKRRDEEEITFRKEERKTIKKEEPAVATVIEEPKPVVIEAPEPAPVTEPEPTPVIEPPVEIVKLEAPEIEGPKVLDKIDLSAIDSSTRPKKSTRAAGTATKKSKAKSGKAGEEEKTIPQVEADQPDVLTPAAELTQEIETEEHVEEDQDLIIENIQAEKLEGPKVLGKIDLPLDNETRPKIDERRKRKRIPIEKKEGGPQGFQKGTGVQRQPGQGRFQPTRPGAGQTSTGQGGGGRFSVGKNTGGQRFGGQRSGSTKDDKLIDEKEIQRKIQETQAKLNYQAAEVLHVEKA
ncbi:MAG: hypothetical protein ABR503_06780 [Chitinophagaceae bacterium]